MTSGTTTHRPVECDRALRLRSDRGVTLPELLMAMMIGGIIIGAVTMALLVAMGPDRQASARMAESNDTQLVSIYLPADLLSVDPEPTPDPNEVNLPGGVNLSPTAWGCSGTAPAGTTNVLNLAWTQPVTWNNAGAAQWNVSYRTQPDTATGTRLLVRYSCKSAGSASSKTVARNLHATTMPVAAVTANKLALTVTEVSGYSYTVAGSRRTPTGVCTVTSVSASPNPSIMADSTGRLQSAVTVTANITGTCTTLQLTYAPEGTVAKTLNFTATDASTRTATIAASQTWSAADGTRTTVFSKRFDVSQIGISTVLASTDLEVQPYLVACSVSSVTASPNPVAIRNAAGQLANNVVVSVPVGAVTGACAALSVQFTPTATVASLPLALSGDGTAYTATIGADTYNWTQGAKSLAIVAGSSTVGSTTLTVSPLAPVICAVTSIVFDTNPMSNGSGTTGNLANPVTVTVNTTGPCTGLKLRFEPVSGSVQTVALSQSGSAWTYQIKKNGSGSFSWSDGSHLFTVLDGAGNALPVTASFVVT